MQTQPTEDDIAEVKTKSNIDKISTSTSCSTAFLLEIESKTNENSRLSENVTKAKLTIEHLEKLITASAHQVDQLTTEHLKIQKELSYQQQEFDKQRNYQAKEIGALKEELELSKNLLDGRINRLARLNNRNAALQHEVNNNRYKIFSMHFKSSAEGEETDDTSQNELSKTATELSYIATSEDDEGEISRSTTSEDLAESTNEDFSS